MIMLLCELFDVDNLPGDLRQTAMDFLTPMAAQKVPFVTMQQMADQLRHAQTGIVIDRGLLMDILDPNEVKIVKKIEGDRIYLTPPDPGRDAENSKDDAEKNQQKIAKSAVDTAKKDIAEK
jgi:hypothetical protein